MRFVASEISVFIGFIAPFPLWYKIFGIYTFCLRDGRSHKRFRNVRSSEQICFEPGVAWVPSSLSLFTCKHPWEWRGRVSYFTLLADMPPTFEKIDETEPTSMSTPNIPGFKVSMYYSNTMKVLYQLVYLRSAGNHASSTRAITSARLRPLTVQVSWGLPSDSECLQVHINQGWWYPHDCP